MKTIKSILAVAFILTCSLTFAQPPSGGQGGQQSPPPIPTDKQIEEMVSNLTNGIALNTEQKAKILELYNAHFAQVKEKTSGSSRPKREEMEALKTALEKKVKNELTKEQIDKYERFIKKQNSPQKRG